MKTGATFPNVLRYPMLSEKHQKALALILSGDSIPTAAKKMGLRRETVWKWTKDPNFATELDRLRQESISALQLEFREASLEAAQTLRNIMNDPEQKATDRIRASIAILDRIVDKTQQPEVRQTVELEEWVDVRSLG
jgi:hypothetical protein